MNDQPPPWWMLQLRLAGALAVLFLAGLFVFAIMAISNTGSLLAGPVVVVYLVACLYLMKRYRRLDAAWRRDIEAIRRTFRRIARNPPP